MYRWRGKVVGLAVFALIASLVAGGLGWVTFAALRLEEEQLASRAEADVRLALWRLDSRIFTDLAHEAARNYQDYRLVNASDTHDRLDSPEILELIPIAKNGESEPAWLGRRFLLPTPHWPTTQAFYEAWRQGLGLYDRAKKSAAIAKSDRPAPRALLFSPALWTTNLQAAALAQASSDTLGGQAYANFLANNATNATENQSRGQQPQARDTTLRFNRAQAEMRQQVPFPNSPANNEVVPGPAAPNAVTIIAGQMTPVWLPTETESVLAVARPLSVGHKPVLEVTLLNWPELQRSLTEEIHDLLPQARLRPIAADQAPIPDRTITAIPAELDPGPLSSASLGDGLSPLRFGLFMAWAAALIALAAVGLGGWSLLNLSERRIRFVSAVTHELRTPMTTLRLYLDMLASGMVREEVQKNEYIQTLNQEADRLNRLVGNVLDFSRLETQRPRLQKTTILVADLLNQARETWESRCRSAGKDLVIDNRLSESATLVTDLTLINQILGNLIDNACKYSRGATDPRIWLRARIEQGRLWIEVEDHGLGVPRRERKSIFRPFRRGQTDHVAAGGVGLGLALARRWSALLGGHLSLAQLESAKGACFRLELRDWK